MIAKEKGGIFMNTRRITSQKGITLVALIITMKMKLVAKQFQQVIIQKII